MLSYQYATLTDNSPERPPIQYSWYNSEVTKIVRALIGAVQFIL
jgi:hypothetical protein